MPQALFDYARSDTHFLLYIYDCIRNDLIDKSNASGPSDGGSGKDPIQSVLERSKDKALQRYEYHFYDNDRGQDQGGWYRLLTKTPTQFTNEQYSVFRAVHRWRDAVARSDDDSIVYVMPNYVLFNMAKIMPADKATLFRIAQQVSPTMRLRADELLRVIANAKADPKAAEMLEAYRKMRREAYTEFRPSNESRNQQRNNPPLAQLPQSLSTSAKQSADTSTAAVVKIPKPVASRSSTSALWGPSLSERSTEQHHEQHENKQKRGNEIRQKKPAGLLPVSLAIPLPPLTASIFVDPTDPFIDGENSHQEQGQNTKQAIDPGARAEHAYIPASERHKKANGKNRRSPEIFTIKSLGTGTKRKATEPMSASGGVNASSAEEAAKKLNGNGQTGSFSKGMQDDVDMLDADGNNNATDADAAAAATAKAAARLARRQEKKRLKLLQKQQEQQPQSQNESKPKRKRKETNVEHEDEGKMEEGVEEEEREEEEEEELDEEEEVKPFDYANAPSVMYPASNDGNKNNRSAAATSPTKKIPNFYARAADAKTGLKRRGQGKGRVGKSGTFAA